MIYKKTLAYSIPAIIVSLKLPFRSQFINFIKNVVMNQHTYTMINASNEKSVLSLKKKHLLRLTS